MKAACPPSRSLLRRPSTVQVREQEVSRAADRVPCPPEHAAHHRRPLYRHPDRARSPILLGAFWRDSAQEIPHLSCVHVLVSFVSLLRMSNVRMFITLTVLKMMCTTVKSMGSWILRFDIYCTWLYAFDIYYPDGLPHRKKVLNLNSNVHMFLT